MESPILVLAVIGDQNGVLASIGKESIRYGTETSDRFPRFFEGSLILAYRSCPEIAFGYR